MTDIQLKQEAVQIANDLQQRAIELQSELDQIRMREAEIIAITDSASLCRERSLNFQSSLNGDLQCPSCWVRNGVHSVLTPISSDIPDVDNFICKVCNQEFSCEV